MVGRRRVSLEVLEPPVLAPRLEIGVPAAGQVQQQDRDGPDKIEESQTPGVFAMRPGNKLELTDSFLACLAGGTRTAARP